MQAGPRRRANPTAGRALVRYSILPVPQTRCRARREGGSELISRRYPTANEIRIGISDGDLPGRNSPPPESPRRGPSNRLNRWWNANPMTAGHGWRWPKRIEVAAAIRRAGPTIPRRNSPSNSHRLGSPKALGGPHTRQLAVLKMRAPQITLSILTCDQILRLPLLAALDLVAALL